MDRYEAKRRSDPIWSNLEIRSVGSHNT